MPRYASSPSSWDSEVDSPPLTPLTPSPPSYSHGPAPGPSRILPIELLSEIFLLCVDHRMDVRNTIQIPLLLSSICSRWRDAAINNPLLWSRLYIALRGVGSASTSTSTSKHNNNKKEKDKCAGLVDAWLARSGACPLTIYVFWEEGPFADTHVVLEKLMAHSERWKTMFFYLPYRAFRAFAAVRNRLPMLTELSLGTDDDVSLPLPSGSASPSYFDMFEIAPRLRSLECVNFSPTILRFPWAQLEEIPLVSGNIADCLDILHRGSRLSKISVIFVEGGPAPSIGVGQHPRINHTHLTSLTIMSPPWNEIIDLGPLFPHLTLPRLESLTLCNLHSPRTFGAESQFTQFLARLHGLRTLHLRKTALPDDQLVEGLKHLTSLTSLIVLSSAPGGGRSTRAGAGDGDGEADLTVTRYLLEALTRNFFSSSPADGMLLPHLRKLELTVSAAAARELDVFIDMLQSRLRGDDFKGDKLSGAHLTEDDEGLARLEHVKVRPAVELDAEFLIRLIELRDYGLDVEVEVEDVAPAEEYE
ncbi:hypothetical protein CVT26_001928 [Gymnopilus dilepis]|uniref:Uncharacterized protein n=1 Tax=Gymnopilus dilepis TaxID=231916 RepID=A0A409VRV4_9AGAR|nr:hypothetical protein CVT26_001928 [Gymnopilus dilepis]